MRFEISKAGKVVAPDVTSCNTEESFSLCSKPSKFLLLQLDKFSVN